MQIHFTSQVTFLGNSSSKVTIQCLGDALLSINPSPLLQPIDFDI